MIITISIPEECLASGLAKYLHSSVRQRLQPVLDGEGNEVPGQTELVNDPVFGGETQQDQVTAWAQWVLDGKLIECEEILPGEGSSAIIDTLKQRRAL